MQETRGWSPGAPVVGGSPPAAAAAPPEEPLAPVPSGAVAPAAGVRALLAAGRVDLDRRGVLALAVVGLLAALVAGALLLRGRPSAQPLAPPPVVAGPSASPSVAAEVVVDVAGTVRRPGLVRLHAGARVDDALRAAGGLLPGASTGALNLARRLSDGEQVLVGIAAPAAGAAAGGPTTGPVEGGQVDLNAATAQDLDGLPGIGPVLADRIIAWRTEHGRFASVDQLREVGGIGESKYQSLKAKVRV